MARTGSKYTEPLPARLVVTATRVKYNKLLSMARHAWRYRFVSERHHLQGYEDALILLLDDWKDLEEADAIAKELLIMKNMKNCTVVEM